MNTPPARPRVWLLPAFFALLLLPVPWGVGLLAAGAVASIGLRTRRRIADQRTRSDATTGAAMVLGSDKRGRTVTLSDPELSVHGLIVGASGAGKSTTMLRILTEQIGRGRPVIAIDMKGSPSFARVLEQAAIAAGRPFQCWSIDGPGRWNPLQYGNATELKDKLMATERFTEPHYQRAAERYVQMVLRVLTAARPGSVPTLTEVVDLMDPLRLPRMLRDVDRGLRERVQDYLAGLTADQLSAVRGLQTRLAVLTESHTGPYLAPPTGDRASALVDLRRALRGPEVVLFSLNSSKYPRLASQIGTIVVQDLVAASGDRLGDAAAGRGNELAIVAIDEFSGLGADHVLALLARGRESGMSVLVATQEMTDMERVERGLRDQVIGVVALKIMHRQETPESARLIAQMVGTERVWEETHQTAARLFLGYDTGRGTRRQVERYIVDPNEVMNLPRGEAIVISKSVGPRPTRVRVEPPRALPAPAPTAEPAHPTASQSHQPGAPEASAPTSRASARRTAPSAALRRAPRVERRPPSSQELDR